MVMCDDQHRGCDGSEIKAKGRTSLHDACRDSELDGVWGYLRQFEYTADRGASRRARGHARCHQPVLHGGQWCRVAASFGRQHGADQRLPLQQADGQPCRRRDRAVRGARGRRVRRAERAQRLHGWLGHGQRQPANRGCDGQRQAQGVAPLGEHARVHGRHHASASGQPGCSPDEHRANDHGLAGYRRAPLRVARLQLQRVPPLASAT